MEKGVVMTQGRALGTAWCVAAVLAMGLMGCGPRVPVEVRAWGAPAADLPDMQRFAISHQLADQQRADRLDRHVAGALQGFFVAHGYLPVRDQSRLIETSADPDRIRRVAGAARSTLAEAGFTPDPKDPHFLISVDYSTGPYEYFVPAAAASGADAADTEAAAIDAGGSSGASGASRSGGRVGQQVEGNPIAPPGRRALTHVHAVAVYVYPARDPSEPVWWGSAVSVKYQPDFSRVMPVLVDEALGEFPRASGKPRHRMAPLVGE